MDNNNINHNSSSLDANTSSQDSFFANINHELKTPINVIKGMNELILHENISESARNYIKNSISACSILENQVNRLITFSRIISKKIEPIVVPFSLCSLLEDIITSISSECKKKNIAFEFEISPSIPISANGDTTLISQVIYDIILDGFKNLETEKITFYAKWQYERQNEGALIIHIDNLLSPSESNISEATKNRLKLCLKMIEYLNGFCDITYDAPVLSFKLSIPLTKNEENITTESNYSYITNNVRMLIVDDYLININVIAMLLKDTQILIDSATSGLEALKLLEAHDYDIIFIDYMMPVMDGAELMCKIREQFPEKYKHIPFYVLSANTNTESRKLLTECGFNGFIPKPIDPKLLKYIIRNNIPEHKLTYISKKTENQISEEEYQMYNEALNKHNINLDDGLNYFSGDIEQYANIIEQLNKSHERSMEILKKHFDKDDLKGIQIYAHTVKGNSKQIGYNTLSQISAIIEENAAKENLKFIMNIKALYIDLLKELKLATDDFLDIYYSYHPTKNNDVMLSKPVNTQYKKELYEYIDNMEAGRALSLIYSVLANHIDTENADTLSQIADLIDELEYNDALILLKEIM